MAWMIPVVGLVLGLIFGHWLVIPVMALVWLVSLFLLVLFDVAGRGMADFWLIVAMLPAGFIFAAIGVVVRRLTGRRAIAA